MARIYGEILSSALMTFDKSFSRSNGQPLDSTEIFYSLAAAEAYAQTDVAYVGQKIVVVETVDEVTTVTHYGIEADNSLKALGASVAGDENTIVVAEDGTVSLYGIEGLELTRDDGEGNQVAITYQPLYVNGKLTWVEPSATTVEGLATEIEGLKTRVSALEGAIGEVADGKTVAEMIAEAAYDDTELAGRVTAIEDDYLKAEDKEELQGNIDAVSAVANAAATQTALEAEIARAKAAEEKNASDIALILDNPDDEAINSIKEFTQYIADHGDVATGLQTQITENKDAIATEKTRAEGVEAGLAADIATKANQTDLDAAVERIAANETAIAGKAAQSDIEDAVERIGANETAIAGKVDAEEGKGLSTNDLTDELLAKLNGVAEGAEVNFIKSVDEEQFAAEAGHLTLLDIAMGKVTGLQDALDAKVNVVEGSRLITSDEATKLEKLVLSEDGTVEVSGEISASNVKELGSWITTNRDSVLGLLSASDDSKLDTIAEGAQVNVLEAVKVGGTLLDIINKTVDIPVATADDLGVVKSSDAENKVAVAEDGTMEVNSLNVNKIVQTEDDVLILNNGNAAG